MHELLYRLGKAHRNYQGLFRLALQRLRRSRYLTVRDRSTGLRFRCRRGADRMLGDVFHAKSYDVPMAPVRPRDVVVDIGANHGFASCYFAHRGASVLAFEPSGDTFEILRWNIALNGLDDRIEARNEAVSDLCGKIRFWESDQLGGGMSTSSDRFAAIHGASGQEAKLVPSVTLECVMAELGDRRIRLLKVDCEGSELSILKTLTDVLRSRLDAIALEYHPESYELSELISLLTSWPGFYVSKCPEHDTTNAMLHVSNRNVVRAWGGLD